MMPFRTLYITFFSFFFFSVPLAVFGASLSEVDSLLHLYDQRRDDARTAIGRQLVGIFAEGAVFFDEAPALSDGMSNEEQDLAVWYGTERYYTTNAYYTEALSYNDRALPLAKKRDTDLYATMLCDRAYCLFKTSDYTQAIEVGREAVRLCQKTGNMLQLSRAYLYISLVNHALQNYDEAKVLVEKSIRTNAKLGVNMQTHNVLGCAAEIFCSARELDKAADYGRQAVEAARAMDYQSGVANHLTQLSYVYDRAGEYALGLAAADSAIAIVMAQDPVDRNQLALSLEFKGWNLIDMKRHREAADVLREAIRLEEEVGNTHAAMYDYRTLSEALEPDDPRAAMKAIRRYTVMSDSLHSAQLKELMSKANAELHNDELQEQNAQERRANRVITFTAMTIVLLLVALVGALWWAFRQKKRTTDILQRLTKDREIFFTNVTHELRTPLTVILGIAREIKTHPSACRVREGNDGAGGSVPVGELGSVLERQAQQLLTLVNQLLDISKLKSSLGQQPMRHGNLTAYVEMQVETSREQARQKGVEVSFERDEAPIELDYVADFVDKVVGNLLSNAIKYTDTGGKVQARLHRKGSQIELEVADTGPGIAASDLPHVFEPFYRTGNAKGIGSGVGLALVKQIVDAVGGKIEVTSSVGEGTTMTVKVPVPQNRLRNSSSGSEETAAVPPSDSVPSKNGNKSLSVSPSRQENLTLHPAKEGVGGGAATSSPSILLVEVNLDVANFIGRQLEGRFEVHHASDGQEGIAQAMTLVPDLIITDLMMPHTDGLALCRTIRANDVTNHIPIIVVTAKATEADRIRGLEAGADAYLYKPFNVDELNIRVNKLLEQRQLMRDKFKNREDTEADSDISSVSNEPRDPIPAAEQAASAPTETVNASSFVAGSETFLERVREVVQQLMPQGACDVERVASELCMSSSQLRRKMNAVTGQSPKKYIQGLQLEQARHLLATHPERTLVEVAEACGYYDLSHFIRVFRNAYGITPGDFLHKK